MSVGNFSATFSGNNNEEPCLLISQKPLWSNEFFCYSTLPASAPLSFTPKMLTSANLDSLGCLNIKRDK